MVYKNRHANKLNSTRSMANHTSRARDTVYLVASSGWQVMLLHVNVQTGDALLPGVLSSGSQKSLRNALPHTSPLATLFPKSTMPSLLALARWAQDVVD